MLIWIVPNYLHKPNTVEGGQGRLLHQQEHIWHTPAPAALWVRSLLAQVGRELGIGAEAAAGGDLVIYLCEAVATNSFCGATCAAWQQVQGESWRLLTMAARKTRNPTIFMIGGFPKGDKRGYSPSRLWKAATGAIKGKSCTSSHTILEKTHYSGTLDGCMHASQSWVIMFPRGEDPEPSANHPGCCFVLIINL